MASSDATSCLSIPLELLRYLVASSATFQDLVGVNTLKDALEYVRTPIETEEPCPTHAIVVQGPTQRAEKVATETWAYSGNAYLTFQLIVPDDYCDEQSQQTWFLNQVGAIKGEMQALAGKGEAFDGLSHLNVVDYQLVEGPAHEPHAEREHEEGEFNGHPLELWWAVFLVEWF